MAKLKKKRVLVTKQFDEEELREYGYRLPFNCRFEGAKAGNFITIMKIRRTDG